MLDEPTASLPKHEVETLFAVLRGLKSRGVSMIYVSHRLDEVYAIADRLAVLRDGKLVAVRETAATDPGELVRLIIGRPPESVFVRPARQEGDPLLRFEAAVIEDVGPLDFTVQAGEIVGLVGLRGAGQELRRPRPLRAHAAQPRQRSGCAAPRPTSAPRRPPSARASASSPATATPTPSPRA